MSTVTYPMESPEAPVKSVLEELEGVDGFYKEQVLPKLQKNMYLELIEWLKQRDLIKRTMTCPNDTCEHAEMTWTSARIVDKFQWVCKCSNKVTIRENSFFKYAKCSVPDSLQIMQGWCTGIDCDQLGNAIHIKNYVIKKIYEYCNSAASQHMQKLLSEEKIGGYNNVVILDVLYLDQKSTNVPIACFADIKDKPPKLIFHPIINKQVSLEPNNNAVGVKGGKYNPKKQKLAEDSNVKMELDQESSDGLTVNNNNNIVDDESSQTSTTTSTSDPGTVHTTSRHMTPSKVLLINELFLLAERKLLLGTDLVLGGSVPPDAVKKILEELEDMSSIITVDELKKRDSETNSVMNNIDQIFKFPRDLVACTRGVIRQRLPDFFMSYAWMELYGSTSETYQTLLKHILESKFE